MTVQIINCAQRDAEWYAARLGKVTASRFSDLMAGGQGKSRDLYLRQLAGEVIAEVPAESFSSAGMEHGTAVEPEALAFYALAMNTEVQPVGFGLLGAGPRENEKLVGRVGASPDGLVDDDGGVEIKRQAPHLLIERMRDGFGDLHTLQLQGNMWVFERQWWDLCCYYPKMPLWRRRFKRDENAIARLRLGVEVFLEDLDKLVDQIRRHR